MGPGIARLPKDEKWFSSRARGRWPCLDRQQRLQALDQTSSMGTWQPPEAQITFQQWFSLVVRQNPSCVSTAKYLYIPFYNMDPNNVWLHLIELIFFLEIIPFLLSTLCQKTFRWSGIPNRIWKMSFTEQSSLIHPSPCFAADIERICWKIPSVPTKDFKRKE